MHMKCVTLPSAHISLVSEWAPQKHHVTLLLIAHHHNFCHPATSTGQWISPLQHQFHHHHTKLHITCDDPATLFSLICCFLKRNDTIFTMLFLSHFCHHWFAIFQMSPHPSWILSPHGIVKCMPTWVSYVGYSRRLTMGTWTWKGRMKRLGIKWNKNAKQESINSLKDQECSIQPRNKSRLCK